MDDILGFRRLVKKLKRDLFPALSRKVYQENIKSAVVKKDGADVMFLVYDKNDQVPWWVLNRKGIVLPCDNILDRVHLPTEAVVITNSFWTCECISYFIHHKVETTCPMCKLHVSEDTKILNTL